MMEAAKSEALETFAVVAFFLGLSVSLAYLFHFAKQAFILGSSAMSMTAWLCYIAIHQIETGVPVDLSADEKHLPSSEDNWVIFSLSSFLFVAGMAMGAAGVNQDNIIQSIFGAGILMTGYFIAHYEFNDKIV
ncbi:MAG: hypothetical protein ABEJ66_00705 [Candidatus Nanohaloarchaea archaeon]